MTIRFLLLPPSGAMPNHPRLPVRLYRTLTTAAGAPFDARAFEHRFAAHGWPPDWRGGMYPFHHYHSTAHEVLGIASGRACVLLGGPDGESIDVAAGDALLLPAGTGHCCVQADADFNMVGAYADGRPWDVARAAPDAAMRERIRTLPDPLRDPVTGEPF